ncbi:ALK and LTK ligand 1 isoform X1 [Lithobates pipiens]
MCNNCLPPSLFPRITKGEMQRARKWQAVLAISLLLVTSSVQAISEVTASDRRTLLDLIVHIGDSSSSSSRESGKVITRRYNEGPAYSAEHGIQRLSSRERSASSPKSSSKRHSEIHSRDSTLRDRFINHFTEILSRDPTLRDRLINHFTAGPVIFSPECSKQFYRLYHNTKDCSTSTSYKRCARLLIRLAKSQLCSQP